MVGTFRSISGQVVRSVAADTDTDPLALPPLYEAIDPDGLDSVVRNMSDGKIQFQYAGRTVTVRSDRGTVGDESVVVTDAPGCRSERATSPADN